MGGGGQGEGGDTDGIDQVGDRGGELGVDRADLQEVVRGGGGDFWLLGWHWSM